jgi:hypothetical protein
MPSDLSAARRSWGPSGRLAGVTSGVAEGSEDPWLCGPGFRRVCPCQGAWRYGSAAVPEPSSGRRGVLVIGWSCSPLRPSWRTYPAHPWVEQHLARLGDRLQRLGFRGAYDTGKDTGAGELADTTNPDSTEVLPGQKLPESGRPDSNRRRPAWEAGILPLNYAREVRVSREVNVTGPLAGVKRVPSTPPGSSGDPARSPPAPPATRCPACLPASTAPGPRPARTGGRTSPR